VTVCNSALRQSGLSLPEAVSEGRNRCARFPTAAEVDRQTSALRHAFQVADALDQSGSRDGHVKLLSGLPETVPVARGVRGAVELHFSEDS
jgi:hypothetical protein